MQVDNIYKGSGLFKKRHRGEECMIGMGDETAAGKTEHELLDDIQLNIGDLGHHLPASRQESPRKG